jgi:integrase
LAIINKAVEWEILGEPPFNTRSKAIRELVPRASGIEHRDRRLRPGEEEKLFAYLDARAGKSDRMGLVGDCSRFVLSLGWRRGTLRRLQFEDLHWDEGPHGTFRVPGSKMKGRRPSVKSLTPETRKIVERRREMFVRLGV